MRHVRSDWTSDTKNDFGRPLSSRGKRDAPRTGQWLSDKRLIPDTFLSSPALRAKQTAILVAKNLDFHEKDLSWDDRIYEALLQELLAVIDEALYLADSIMLVGHNPGLDSLLTYLSIGPLKLNANGKLMTTAAVAVFDYGKVKVLYQLLNLVGLCRHLCGLKELG